MASPDTPRAVHRRLRVDGFGDRDTLVVRSMVRLLEGRTRDHWQAVEADPVHVLIVPIGTPEVAPGPMIVVHIALPLRADDLWSQLDRASAALGDAEQMVRPTRGGVAATPPPGRAAPEGVRRLQLLRWPPDHLLKSDLRYLRLATTLGTRPFAMDDLSARSGIPLAVCHTFAAVLHANGVAQWLIDDHVVDGPEADPSGLFARIRARLRPEGSR